MPERNILDLLANVAHWTARPRHLGPLSGSEPKLADRTLKFFRPSKDATKYRHIDALFNDTID